jgi:hypothetical protein
MGIFESLAVLLEGFLRVEGVFLTDFIKIRIPHENGMLTANRGAIGIHTAGLWKSMLKHGYPH